MTDLMTNRNRMEPDIDGIPISTVVERLKTVTRQRDEAVAALKRYASQLESVEIVMIRNAIRKATD